MMRRPFCVFLVRACSDYLCRKRATVQYGFKRFFVMAHQKEIPLHISYLPDIVFSSGFPDVLIPHPIGESAVVTVTADGETLLRETLYPTDDGIVLEDMGGLVELYARQRLTVLVNVHATAASGRSYDKDVRVLYSRTDIGEDISAEEFYECSFLTVLQGRKLTALGRMELLNYYGTEDAEVTALYDDGTTEVFAARVTGGNDNYRHIDVSPGQYVAEGKTLCSYTVTAGSRTQEFVVEPEQLDCAPVLCFVNSFGVEELLYCTGLHQISPEYKRSQARIDGYLRNYKIETIRHFKADTGPLNEWMAEWVDDLFHSDEVHLYHYEDGVLRPGREVVITESKSDRSNDDAEIPRFTFTYEYAQRNHNVLAFRQRREGRIFDDSFDDTFS